MVATTLSAMHTSVTNTAILRNFLCGIAAANLLLMPYFVALVSLHSRREDCSNVGALKFPLAGQRHTALVNDKLQSLGLPLWNHQNWHLRRKQDEFRGAAFWQQRSVGRGHIALMVLCEGPFQWVHGPLSLHSSERRFLSDIADIGVKTHLAFTSVAHAVAVSDFMGASQSADAVPCPMDHPDLIPLLWSEKRQVWHSNPKDDLIRLPPETIERCGHWKCFSALPGQGQADLQHVGTLSEVLERWAETYRCRQLLQVSALLQLPPLLVMLIGHNVWKDVAAIFHSKSSRNPL